MKNNRLILALGVTAVFGLSSVYFYHSKSTASKKNLSDEALLAIIKNDQKAFEEFIKQGGDVHSILPMIDGKAYTVAEGIAQFERKGFIEYLQRMKIAFIKQDLAKDWDMLSLTVARNNPEVMNLLINEKPNLTRGYGKKGWSLLHMASAECSHKMVSILHASGMKWNQRAKDGSTPLTIAAEKDCLPVLSYWKEQSADFKAKDGRGLTALGILKKKKDAALVAFAQSFEPKRLPASAPEELNFYKKRKIPKVNLADRSLLIEPELRPEEANETSEFSEFAD